MVAKQGEGGIKALVGGDSGEICRPIFNLWLLSRDYSAPKGDDEVDPAANGSGIYILWRPPIRQSPPVFHTSLRGSERIRQILSRCCSRRPAHSAHVQSPHPALVCVAAIVCVLRPPTPIHSRPAVDH
jgi:hypothetical protein